MQSEPRATAGTGPALDQRIGALLPLVRRLGELRPRPRAERLSGLHNPWGHASVLTDAWRFLDVCEDAQLLAAIARLIGPDIVLWDSELHFKAASYRRFAAEGREGRYWPSQPLAGAVALIAPARLSAGLTCLDVRDVAQADLSGLQPDDALYVIRYMSAASRFVRDPRFPPNRAGMEEQPLINYTLRPLWLVSGHDRAGNDFVTGFAPAVPRWAGIQ